MKSNERIGGRWPRWAIVTGIPLACAVVFFFCVHLMWSPGSPGTRFDAPTAKPVSKEYESSQGTLGNKRETNISGERFAPPFARASPECETDSARSSLEGSDFEGPASDPFSPQLRNGPEVRVLVARGNLRLGVLQSSRVLDEPALKELLATIGSDLEDFVAGGDGFVAADLQGVLDGYKDALGRCAEGEVEIRGPGWMIGVEVGEPKPIEENWHPRPL